MFLKQEKDFVMYPSKFIISSSNINECKVKDNDESHSWRDE